MQAAGFGGRVSAALNGTPMAGRIAMPMPVTGEFRPFTYIGINEVNSHNYLFVY